VLFFERYFSPSDSALGLVFELRLKTVVPCMRQAAVRWGTSLKCWFETSKQTREQTAMPGADVKGERASISPGQSPLCCSPRPCIAE